MRMRSRQYRPMRVLHSGPEVWSKYNSALQGQTLQTNKAEVTHLLITLLINFFLHVQVFNKHITVTRKRITNLRTIFQGLIDEAEFSTSMSRRGPRNCWRQLSYAIKHKEPARSKQNTPLGVFCVPKPLVGGFGCPSWFFMA